MIQTLSSSCPVFDLSVAAFLAISLPWYIIFIILSSRQACTSSERFAPSAIVYNNQPNQHVKEAASCSNSRGKHHEVGRCSIGVFALSLVESLLWHYWRWFQWRHGIWHTYCKLLRCCLCDLDNGCSSSNNRRVTRFTPFFMTFSPEEYFELFLGSEFVFVTQ